ncbi:transcriptional regulator MntR, partial [Bacillus paralicheniformis]|uniref:transcriptional regulator MntR n=1 Tax=Bacillus paralicheniformis TaxID=1648923 RepID=UPI00210CD867
MTTPSMEDYIEQIYMLIEEKGYARVSDIAEALAVHPSSVTKMVQKLDKDEYLIYEKYRGLVLTPKGKKIGKRLVYRHELLEQFLRIIGVDEEKIYDDVEGIEHHLSWNSIDRVYCCLNEVWPLSLYVFSLITSLKYVIASAFFS